MFLLVVEEARRVKGETAGENDRPFTAWSENLRGFAFLCPERAIEGL